MSLINEALKRAKEAQPKTPPGGAPPLPPVELPSRGGNSTWILILAAVLFLAAIGFLLSATFSRHKAAVPAAALPAPEPVIVAQAKPEQTNPPEIAKTPAASAPVETVKIGEHLPKVQGILFDAVHPVAIVDGKMKRVGDYDGKYLVEEISRDSVTFQRADGSREKLHIGE